MRGAFVFHRTGPGGYSPIKVTGVLVVPFKFVDILVPLRVLKP